MYDASRQQEGGIRLSGGLFRIGHYAVEQAAIPVVEIAIHVVMAEVPAFEPYDAGQVFQVLGEFIPLE